MYKYLSKTIMIAAAMTALVVLAVAVMAQGAKSAKPSASTLADKRDGKVYKTVKVGNQVWMAENLNYDIPDNTKDVCYDEKEDSCAKYGRMYSWYAVMGIDEVYNKFWGGSDVKHQGVCPAGWHVPNDSEWDTLLNYAGGAKTAAKKLKSANGWKNNGNGTDDYGFSALPGGRRCGGFGSGGAWGGWWSATENSATDRYNSAWYRSIVYSHDDVDRLDGCSGGKSDRFSVRCVAD